MEIKEKSNITVYVADFDENFVDLVSSDPMTENYVSDNYIYILPKTKACFKEFPHQFMETTVYIEKITGREVYLSQVHWLYMKNLIKAELGLEVKIIKRYPGILTVGELRTPNQGIDKAALKKLSEKFSEKIYIKPLNTHLNQSKLI